MKNKFGYLLVTLLLLLCYTRATAQVKTVTLSGTVKENATATIPYANVILKKPDGTSIAGTITNEQGNFSLTTAPGKYVLEISSIGFAPMRKDVFIGALSDYLDVGDVLLSVDAQQLQEVVVMAQQDAVSSKMDKKAFTLADNIAQTGGSVLQAMQNLPGVTTQDGKVQLRGNDKVMILIDGKQTALTGFNSQSGLDLSLIHI